MKLFLRNLWIIAGLAATLTLTACSRLVSLEPLATKDNTIFDPALLGVWSTATPEPEQWNDDYDGGLITVYQGEEQTYDITYFDFKRDVRYRLDGRLTSINGQHILDITPHETDGSALSIAAHAFVHVESRPNGLSVQFLDSQWLQDKATKSSSLPHHESGSGVILTGTAAQLQSFIAQFGLKEQAQSDAVLLERLK